MFQLECEDQIFPKFCEQPTTKECSQNFESNWHDYADRAKESTLSEQEEKAFSLFKRANKPGNKWVKQYKTFELNVNGTMKVILRRMESKKDENGDEKLELGREVISQEEVFDAINDIHRSTGHMGMERTHTHCADKYYSITQDMVRKYCRTCHVCIEANPVIESESPIVEEKPDAINSST